MKRPLAAALIAATVLLVGACGSQAGAAATTTAGDVSERDLSAQVQEVLTAQGLSPDAPDAPLTSKTLYRMILAIVIGDMARQTGVTVTQGDIDMTIAQAVANAGGQKAFDDALASGGIAPSEVQTVARINLQAQAISRALVPQGTAQEQSDAFSKALAATAQKLQVTVNPRFGTWDATQAMVVPAPFDLSAPPTAAR